MTEKQAYKLEKELQQIALGRFIKKSDPDWDFTDWLSEKELQQYKVAFKIINGYCLFCGDMECDCK